jgi:hypothetical protein
MSESFPDPAPTPPSEAALQRLNPTVRWVWLGGCVIFFFVVLTLGLIVEFIVRRSNDDWNWPLGTICLPTAFLLSGWAATYSMMRYASWGFAVREEDVVIQSGVFWKKRRCVPRNRVQHVDITSGPLDRAFGLVEVHLFTAGSMGAVAEIEGLSPESAEQLRAALVRSSSDGV